MDLFMEMDLVIGNQYFNYLINFFGMQIVVGQFVIDSVYKSGNFVMV